MGQVKPKCLSPNQISELVWDSKSDEAWALSNSSSEDKGGFLDKPGVSHLQQDHPTSSDQASSSLFSSTVSDEEVFQKGQVNNFSGCPTGHPYVKLEPQLDTKGQGTERFEMRRNSFLFSH